MLWGEGCPSLPLEPRLALNSPASDSQMLPPSPPPSGRVYVAQAGFKHPVTSDAQAQSPECCIFNVYHHMYTSSQGDIIDGNM